MPFTEDPQLRWLEDNLVRLAELNAVLDRLTIRLGQITRRADYLKPITDGATGDAAEARATIQAIVDSAFDVEGFDLGSLGSTTKRMFKELSVIRGSR